MARNVRTTFLYIVAFIVFIVSVYNHIFHVPVSVPGAGDHLSVHPLPLLIPHHAIHEFTPQNSAPATFNSSGNQLPPGSISTVSFLFPGWEVLVVVSPETPPLNVTNGKYYYCHFNTKEISPAKPAGVLQNPTRQTFICELPTRVRKRLPFHQPIFIDSPEIPRGHSKHYSWTEMLRWNDVVYESFTTDDDVVLFVKGVNTRQGVNRNPAEFRCVFGEGDNAVKTAVTSSMQEVFRCQSPNLTAVNWFEKQEPIKVALEVVETNLLVPSVAYYTPPRTIANNGEKVQLCACTMVYNVAKFLKEWVVYHSKIGVEKFILYDNGSDDDLGKVVTNLIREGYDVETLFWMWPKTQEAGFSHSALRANGSCNWMAYIDVDEFVYSPKWSNVGEPSKLLQNFLPKKTLQKKNNNVVEPQIGQLMIGCNEFGPSNQKSHPKKGVMQGYNCRKRVENRHKSIVKLDAIDHSLVNVIHHFRLREGYKVKRLNILQAVVNHYKFQAWTEFKAKFRRRVSAYVVDWTATGNVKSNDRTPGLGFKAVEPKGWSEKFCEVKDDGLKNLTRKWFGVEDSATDYHMIWQR